MDSKYFRPIVLTGIIVLDILIIWGLIELVRYFL